MGSVYCISALYIDINNHKKESWKLLNFIF